MGSYWLIQGQIELGGAKERFQMGRDRLRERQEPNGRLVFPPVLFVQGVEHHLHRLGRSQQPLDFFRRDGI